VGLRFTSKANEASVFGGGVVAFGGVGFVGGGLLEGVHTEEPFGAAFFVAGFRFESVEARGMPTEGAGRVKFFFTAFAYEGALGGRGCLDFDVAFDTVLGAALVFAPGRDGNFAGGAALRLFVIDAEGARKRPERGYFLGSERALLLLRTQGQHFRCSWKRRR
jgi:hypothetical protein